MQKLNAIRENFRIARLTPSDAHSKSDHLRTFRNLVVSNEQMYPGIDRWFDTKVVPGVKNRERVAFVGYVGEKPVVSAVVKRGVHTKFCHLKISDELQDAHLGEAFFSMMALEVRNKAGEIHFTLPEGLWERKRAFFNSFGFTKVEKAGTQYRLFEQELRCSAPFSEVWTCVLRKLPKISSLFSMGGYSMSNDLLMSIQPKSAGRVLNGQKKIEIRRKFSTKWIGHRVCLYASSPTSALVGEARIGGVVVGRPEDIWANFHAMIGCTKEEFDAYTKLAGQVYAIVFDEVRPYKGNIPLAHANYLLDADLVPPQSYCTLEKGKPWAQAVSVAAMLHGNFKPSVEYSLQAY